MSKYFIDTSDIERKEAAPGLVIRTFYGERLMISLVESPAHASPPPHTHPDHEQAGMVLSGEYEMTIGDERRLLKPGDAYVIPPGVEHALHGLDGRVIYTFRCPKDFGYFVYSFNKGFS